MSITKSIPNLQSCHFRIFFNTYLLYVLYKWIIHTITAHIFHLCSSSYFTKSKVVPQYTVRQLDRWDTQPEPSLISTLNGCEWSIYCRHKSTIQSQWPACTGHWSVKNYIPFSFIKCVTGMTHSLKWLSYGLENQEIITQFPTIFHLCKVSRPTLEPTQLAY